MSLHTIHRSEYSAIYVRRNCGVWHLLSPSNKNHRARMTALPQHSKSIELSTCSSTVHKYLVWVSIDRNTCAHATLSALSGRHFRASSFSRSKLLTPTVMPVAQWFTESSGYTGLRSVSRCAESCYRRPHSVMCPHCDLSSCTLLCSARYLMSKIYFCTTQCACEFIQKSEISLRRYIDLRVDTFQTTSPRLACAASSQQLIG